MDRSVPARLWCSVAWTLLILAIAGCSSSSQVPIRQTLAAPTPTFDPFDPCGRAASSNPPTGTPEAVALRDLQSWSQFPIQTVRARSVSNDGSFARVLVCADVRRGSTDAWDEFSGEYVLSF